MNNNLKCERGEAYKHGYIRVSEMQMREFHFLLKYSRHETYGTPREIVIGKKMEDESIHRHDMMNFGASWNQYCREEKAAGEEKQRYKCKDCGKNFLEADGRSKPTTEAKRALAVMLYTFSKASYNFLAKKIFHCSPTTIMNWVKKASSEVKMPEITNDIKEIEFDEMWHFIGSKKQKMDLQSC